VLLPVGTVGSVLGYPFAVSRPTLLVDSRLLRGASQPARVVGTPTCGAGAGTPSYVCGAGAG